MKKYFLLVGIFAIMSSAALNAQVTIGADRPANADAILELVSADKGLLLPTVALQRPHSPSPLTAFVPGMVVYNTTVLQDSLQNGLYICDGNQWFAFKQTPTPLTQPEWFYVAFPISVESAGIYTVNLYEQYKKQFDHTMTGSNMVRNSFAPAKPLSRVYEKEDLNYYVTGFDSSVFGSSITVDNDGIMQYTITPANLSNVSDSTFMNVVFVVK